MKKYNIYTLLLILISIISCSELEENAISNISLENISDERDAQTLLRGAYTNLMPNRLYGKEYTVVTQQLSDVITLGQNNPTRQQLDNFTFDSGLSSFESLWKQYYLSIGAANFAITGASQVSYVNDPGDVRKRQFIAEARMVRALCYFGMVRFWGDVPYIDETTENPESKPRTSVQEVYNKILEDCVYAIDNLPDQLKVNGTQVKSRASKAAAYALISDVYLHLKDYQNAQVYAEFVINEKEKYNVGLLDNYEEIFRAENGSTLEHVWCFDFKDGITFARYGNAQGDVNQDQATALMGMYNGQEIDNGRWKGFGTNVTTPNVVNVWDDNDFRKRSTLLLEGTNANGDVVDYNQFPIKAPHIAKWRRNPGGLTGSVGTNTSHNYSIYRYADILLIAAEAAIQQQDVATATNYVNLLRERARKADGTLRTEPSNYTAVTIEDVRKERVMELSFEFKRWFDIKRYADQDNRSIVDYFTNTGLQGEVSNVKNFHKLIPIPQAEVNRNPNLTQNEGY